MLPHNNGRATDSGSCRRRAKGVRRGAAMLFCLLLAPLGSEQLDAQKPATNVNGNLIPREMGDIPDVTIQYQQFESLLASFRRNVDASALARVIRDDVDSQVLVRATGARARTLAPRRGEAPQLTCSGAQTLPTLPVMLSRTTTRNPYCPGKSSNVSGP
jgi:hypothetical protein